MPISWNEIRHNAITFARDWAGVVTDAYKGSGPVHVAFGAFGDHAITHAGGKIIRVWDSRSGALINTIETGLPEKRNANWFINNRIVFSGNGEYALAYNRDNFAPASLLSLADGTLIRRYKFPDNSSFNIALSEDGKSVYLLDKGDLNRWPGRPKRAGSLERRRAPMASICRRSWPHRTGATAPKRYWRHRRACWPPRPDRWTSWWERRCWPRVTTFRGSPWLVCSMQTRD